MAFALLVVKILLSLGLISGFIVYVFFNAVGDNDAAAQSAFYTQIVAVLTLIIALFF